MNKVKEMMLLVESKYYEGQVIIINPNVGGGVGIVKSVKGSYMTVKKHHDKTFSYHETDIADVDKAPHGWMDDKRSRKNFR